MTFLPLLLAIYMYTIIHLFYEFKTLTIVDSHNNFIYMLLTAYWTVLVFIIMIINH